LFTLSSGIGGIAVAAAIAGAAILPARRRILLAGGLLVAAGFLVASVGYRVPAGLGHVPVPGGEWHVLKGPRVHTWLSAVATIRDHPVTGVGYGSLVAHAPRLRRWYRQGYAEALHIDRPPTKDAHQTWLSVAGQTGLVGLAAFVVLLVACARGLPVPGRRGPPDGTAGRLGVAVLAGLAGTVGYHGLFASVEEFRHVWALLALGVVALRLRGSARA
jgi:O-antigen ligase